MKKRQSGIVSLMTAVIVSTLVMAVAIPLAYLNTISSQGASDSELSLRAYAAAAGGVEWAYWWAKTNPNQNIDTTSTCNAAPSGYSFSTAGGVTDPFTFFNSSTNSSNILTCMKVLGSGFSMSGLLDASSAYQVLVPPNVNPLKAIQVNWITSGTDTNSDVPSAWSGYSGSTLPSNPTAAFPPGIELTIVNFQATPAGCPNVSNCVVTPGAFYSNLSARNVVLLPNTLPGNDGTSPPKKILVACSAVALPNPPYECSSSAPTTAGGLLPSTSPDASLVFANNTTNGALDTAHGAIVYIRAIYPTPNHQFNYSLKLYDTSNNLMTPQTSSSVIDVTAKAGPVYRRIVATASSTNPSVPAGLNYVLFSDTSICKDFSIFNSGGTYTVQPNTTCTNGLGF